MQRELLSHDGSYPTAGMSRLSGGFRNRRNLAVAGALLAIAGAVIGTRVASGKHPQPVPVSTATYSNEEGGYALRYPTDWKATAVGPITKFTTTSKDLIVGVGRAPSGTLAESSQRFTAELLKLYRGTRVDARRLQKIGGRDAAIVAGSGKNLTGTVLRWMTITITQAGRNYGISVFASAGSDPSTVLPELQSLVASFTPIS